MDLQSYLPIHVAAKINTVRMNLLRLIAEINGMKGALNLVTLTRFVFYDEMTSIHKCFHSLTCFYCYRLSMV